MHGVPFPSLIALLCNLQCNSLNPIKDEGLRIDYKLGIQIALYCLKGADHIAFMDKPFICLHPGMVVNNMY